MNTLTLEKLVLAGLGGALVAKEQIEEAIDKLVNRGELNREQARSLVDDFSTKAEGEKDRLETRGREELRKFFADMNLVFVDDLRKLEARLAVLEEKLEKVETVGAR